MELVISRINPLLFEIVCRGEILQSDFRKESNPLIRLLDPSDFARAALIDLAGVTFLGSSGVSWMVSTHRLFETAGGVVVIHSIPERLNVVFSILKMDEVLHLSQKREDALNRIWAECFLKPNLNPTGLLSWKDTEF